ncbi:MAG: hypothetical protein ACRDDI_13620 [Aeromonas veronii]
MRDPFLRAQQAGIRRLGKYNKVTIITELGEERDIPATFINPTTNDKLRQSGTSKGGRDFRQSAKRLRALDSDVVGICQDWVIVVNGERYFPASHEPNGVGSTLIYLAIEKAPAGGGNGWQ